MTPHLPNHPSLQDYRLIHFDGIALYNEEREKNRKHGGPTDSDDQELTWKNSSGQYHRDDGPAIIRSSGQCEWRQNGQKHRLKKPSFINSSMKFLAWHREGKVHRIGGFAYFDATLNLYRLFIDDKRFFHPEDYIKACKDWLIDHESAHDCLEKFHELDKILQLGYLNASQWKDGNFTPQEHLYETSSASNSATL